MYIYTVEIHTSAVITMRPTKKHGGKKSGGVLQVRQAASQMCIQAEGTHALLASLITHHVFFLFSFFLFTTRVITKLSKTKGSKKFPS